MKCASSRGLLRKLAVGLVLFAAGCTLPPPLPPPAAHSKPESEVSGFQPTLILMSLDGFRWDFLEPGVTPTLSHLAAEGVHADRLIPSFPTKTFPNHYTIVTGLRPAEHGLVANNIFDPTTGERFSLSNRKAVADGRWYGGVPIWVTAERAGLRTAPLFWPGSEAEILGVRPTLSRPYDGTISPEDRVDLVLGWLDLPASERPAFVTLYFEDVDDGAHRYGPEPSKGLQQALSTVDRAVKRLLEGLEQRGLTSRVDLVIVSDHGMSATSAERVVFLDDYVDPETAGVIDWSPILGLWPAKKDLDSVYAALEGAHPHLAVYRREDIPAHYEFSGHERIPPIIGISDDGWSVTTRAHLESCPHCFDGGSHGYDQRLESMGALLIARGPSFRRHTTIPPIENYHIYNVLCAVLGLEPAPNSGAPERVQELLSSPPG